jgi:NTE family protein
MKQSLELRKLYFNTSLPSNPEKDKTVSNESNTLTFFGNAVCQHHNHSPEFENGNHDVLLALYPIFLKLSTDLLTSKIDKNLLDRARHSLNIHSPFDCLEHFNKISGDAHVIIHIIVKLIKELKEGACQKIYDLLKEVRHLLYSDINLLKANYFGKWDLSLPQCIRILSLFKQEKHPDASKLLDGLRNKIEPVQTAKGGVHHDDLSNGGLERYRFGLGA